MKSSGLRIDRRSRVPLHRQLYDRIRGAIETGVLKPGERLASARSLAAQLDVARGTVDAAFSRLAGEGYVVMRGPRGTLVAPDFRARRPPRRSTSLRADTVPSSHSTALPLQLGLPALDLFPRKLWARIAARQARALAGAALAYPDPAGLPALREAVAGYLAVSRGVIASPEAIVITSGYQGALSLVTALALNRGDRIWFENPGYRIARDALAAQGFGLVPVPVDGEGLMVGEAKRRAPRARLAVVTPAHQSPLGVTLSFPRRQALLDWALGREAWILEDDYDSEFHYSGHKPPALKSLDAADRVFYAGSFSKSLFPGLRLGYLVVPARFGADAARLCRQRHRGHSVLDQAVASAFIAEGHFARHLRRMRLAYRARRDALSRALRARFEGRIALASAQGGLHVLARWDGLRSDKVAAAKALVLGLKPAALSDLFLGFTADQGLLMSFTNVAEKDAPAIVRRLARALE
jgi:GntR family transcriptional regulator/MocR family aminotransferase